MAYNTKPIITDKDGNPISQYYNPDTDSYEPVEGSHGANKVLVENNDLSLIPILDKLSQLTGTVIDEETRKTNEQNRQSNEVTRIENEDIRKSNELERIDNENTRLSNEDVRKSNELQRIELYNQILNMLETGQLKGEKGDKGDTGIGLNFLWQGTSLGVKLETDAEYVFVDLRGPQGPPGTIENLDLTGSPGRPFLIAGDMQEGFFGEVPSSELITGDALASQVGISQGNSQHSAAGWLKFAWKGKILFIAKKPIRNSISWDAINTAKCVYGDSGDKTVEIGGLTYKVRLMRALEPSNDPKTTASANSGTVNHYSEWNRLMCQIHEQAIDKSWDYPNNIENDIGILEHNLGSGRQGMYSDADLVVKSGDGRASWCQEMGTSTSYRLQRGYGGVSYSNNNPSYNTGSNFGWRPVLELVE